MDQPVRRWGPTAVVAAILLVLAGVLVAVAFTGGLLADDRGLLDGAAAGRSPGLTTAAVVLTTVGNTAAMAVLAVVVGGVLFVRGRRAEGVYLVATMGSASVVFTVVKNLLDRPRPPAELQVLRETNESLPSGHATMSATVIGAIVILAWPHLAALGRALAVVAAVLWVGAVGATRIYLGVHWFSDVLAGWTLGLGWASLGAAILFRWCAPAPAAPDAQDAAERG
ncbi:phosphatase PAP2 family protein [Pseudonocardia sp. KRD291]|uniref:phosphatase PAP2 family protein n=1 Tax=Pseudonocardia sp. KRD291 TaxID=2792007 RepID=UPI001C4A1375|nr:phosphatase PAP2 family protein [Pseudonocardia sp. KRD291]MBW0102508.1 phosphatase PAP2 family protein [Pseudonocardia sp. KRD291]